MNRKAWRVMAAGLGLCVLAVSQPAFAAPQDQRKQVSLRYFRGLVFFESGQYDEALDEFQAVAAIDPAYRDTQAYIKKTVGMLEGSRDHLRAASKERPEGDVDLYFLGKSYYEKGDYKRAREAFKVVLVKNPNDRFAKYYLALTQQAMGAKADRKKGKIPAEKAAESVLTLADEVSYVKQDIQDQEETRAFYEEKARRREERDELIQQKERDLKRQEELLEEERQDYLAQKKLTDRAQKIAKVSEKWRNMRERLESKQPGTPTDLTEYPVYANRADLAYRKMKEALRASRWNTAGLSAIDASLHYCDALLIYFYGIKSAYPSHDNINTLLQQNVKRSDTEENIVRLRGVLNLKRLAEDEDRPFSRSEAIFLADKAEKIAEWCRSVLP